MLGVSRRSGTDEIRSRFRQLSKTMHPDAGGDTDEYVRLLEAYHTLTDDTARREYDRRLELLSASVQLKQSAAGELNTDIYISAYENITGCTREMEYGRSIIKIHVPKGTQDGSVIQIRNYNGSGVNMNISVHIVLPPSCEFRKYMNMNEVVYLLRMTKNMLGRQIGISPLGEDIFVTIPKDTQNGKMFKLKNRGCYNGDIRSDLYVKVLLK
jgi:DnaJ-class molecular chaperone